MLAAARICSARERTNCRVPRGALCAVGRALAGPTDGLEGNRRVSGHCRSHIDQLGEMDCTGRSMGHDPESLTIVQETRLQRRNGSRGTVCHSLVNKNQTCRCCHCRRVPLSPSRCNACSGNKQRQARRDPARACRGPYSAPVPVSGTLLEEGVCPGTPDAWVMAMGVGLRRHAPDAQALRLALAKPML